MIETLITSALAASLLLAPVTGLETFAGQASVAGQVLIEQAGELVTRQKVLSRESLDLGDRYPVESISEGFKENILIAVGFLNSSNPGGLVLRPGEIFAFHNKGILPQFKENKIITQESDFTTNTGYKVVAGLGGNGVCHLASLMNLAASKAGLEVTAPTSHSFAKIPGIESQYGTSISTRNSPERQNLYIKNTFDFPVRLEFSLDGNLLTMKVLAN